MILIVIWGLCFVAPRVTESNREDAMSSVKQSSCHFLFPDRIQDCVEETTVNLKYPGGTYSVG